MTVTATKGARMAELRGELVRRLATVDFAGRYYAWYEQSPPPGDPPRLGQAAYEAALAELPLDFTYDRRERFFGASERFPGAETGLNVAFGPGRAELILKVTVAGERVGAPFTLLARQVAQLADPDFSYTPRAPKLYFADEAGLRATLRVAIGLYEDARRVVLDEPWS
jgi:hypothetical protein